MLSYFLATLENDADRQAFAAIYDQYHAKMENTAMKILKNQGDAEDAVQNAFMQVIRHFEKTYQIPCEDLPFWLISIVKNEAYMILRKKKQTAARTLTRKTPCPRGRGYRIRTWTGICKKGKQLSP